MAPDGELRVWESDAHLMYDGDRYWTRLESMSIRADVERGVYRLIRERDEARSFARGVYRWGPKAQWEDWERIMPWLVGWRRGEATDGESDGD